MSLAEQLREEGKLDGEFKSKLEIAKRMLDAGSDPVFVEKVTGLPHDKIEALLKKQKS